MHQVSGIRVRRESRRKPFPEVIDDNTADSSQERLQLPQGLAFQGMWPRSETQVQGGSRGQSGKLNRHGHCLGGLFMLLFVCSFVHSFICFKRSSSTIDPIQKKKEVGG